MCKYALLVALLVACDGGATDATDLDTDGDSDTELPANVDIVMVTSLGTITVDLLDDEVPGAAANFRQYAADGFYDGTDGGRATLVHRVQAPLLFEAGVYETNLAEKATRAPIPNTSSTSPSNKRGTLSALKIQGSDEHTAGFFINVQDNTYLDGRDGDDGNTVFGTVVQGLDVVDAIGAVATERRSGFDEIPETDVVFESVTVVER